MRKTSPILLPEQSNELADGQILDQPDSLVRSESEPEYDNLYQELASSSNQQEHHSHAPQRQSQYTNPFLIDDEFFPTEHSVNDENASENLSQAIQNTSATMPIHELPTTDSSSLNTDFLNNYVMTQQQQTELLGVNTTDTQLNVNLLQNEVTNEMNRPRQMGRRAEIRPRILSITAECCAEGNQVFSFC